MKKISLLILLLITACFFVLSCSKEYNEDDDYYPDYSDEDDEANNEDDETLDKNNNKENGYTLKTFSNSDDFGNAGTYTAINKKASAGELIKLTATVKSGYTFKGWYIENERVSIFLEYTHVMKSKDTTIEARFDHCTLTTLSSTDDNGLAGTYTKLNEEKIRPGQKVTLTATNNPGYNFVGWYIKNTCISKEKNYIFEMKETDVTIEARYNYYTLTVYSSSSNYGLAGKFDEKKSEKISVGETVSLAASANAGYNFDGWYIGQTLISESPDYAFVMKAENTTIQAKFSSYTVTTQCFSNDNGLAGSYSIKNAERVSYNTQVTLTATVNDGYNFEGWYIYDSKVGSSLEYSFNMPKDNVVVTAKYSSYTLTANGYLYSSKINSAIGTISQYNDKKISAGKTVTLTATVKDGYTFDGWYSDSTLMCSELSYSFTMPKEDVTITAEYSYHTLTTEAICRGGLDLHSVIGTISEHDDTKISAGKTVTLTATVKDGYNFDGWYSYYDDVLLTSDFEYEFIMPKEDVKFYAKYSYYTLTTEAYGSYSSSAGTISEYDGTKISAGKTVTLSATVKDGYTFEGWYSDYDNVLLTSDLEYEFIMPKEDVSFYAKYSYYTLSTHKECTNGSSSPAGTITEFDDIKVSAGKTVTLTATVKEGYRFLGWYDDYSDELISNSMQYSFIMQKSDTYIHALFEKI